MRAPVSSIVQSLELPRLVRLEDNLYAAAFTLMKLLPARYMLDRAAESGELSPDTTVIETTSGTFGLALAMVCRLRGNRLVVVGDPVIDDALKRRLELLRATVEIVREPAPVGGFQRSRLDRVHELQKQTPDHFTPNQYDNPNNSAAYGPVAELLAEALGRIDCLVGTVGSGGSTCGTAKFLRTLFPELHLVGVDTPGSVLFGTPDRPRLLRGLGNSLLPRNVDHTEFDEVHWVAAPEAFAATHALYGDRCLYMGPTSGAAWLVARWWIRRHPDACVVALLPDEGHRYEGTVYDPEWLSANIGGISVPAEPQRVEHPGEVGDSWAWTAWGRRSLREVCGSEVVAA
jgi:cysteine synthase